MTDLDNCYQDQKRAEAYAKLEFAGTYYLAYRDLPHIISEHARGKKAIDFGCGSGRSTRFLRKLGFDVTGVDISSDMIAMAKRMDPEGDYRLIKDADFSQFAAGSVDLVQSVFTFDNIPTGERKVKIFDAMRRLLNDTGKIVSLVSSPEIYTHEWASFSTRDFPENKSAKSGDKVRIIITDIADRRPVEDIVWSDEAYRDVYSRAGLDICAKLAPLANGDEPFSWINETRIAPWVIYVLQNTRAQT